MKPEDIVLTLKKRLKKEQSLMLKIKVIPKSKNSQIIGWLGDEILKIKIAATPEKGKANQELINFLSEILSVPTNQIEIVKGQTSAFKLVSITL